MQGCQGRRLLLQRNKSNENRKMCLLWKKINNKKLRNKKKRRKEFS